MRNQHIPRKATSKPSKITTWQPDYLYAGGQFQAGWTLAADAGGRVVRVGPAEKGVKAVMLKGRALLPGLVNAHSHAFQRVIRGRTETRTTAQDSFWTWREQMYHAALSLSPDDVYTASRMAFLEMALSGITTVGEFHYLHHAPDGTLYDNPNELALQVVRAAQDVGLRICLLRVAYARAGHNVADNPRQARFIEKDAETFLKHAGALRAVLSNPPTKAEMPNAKWLGIAPHSVRAVPLAYLKEVSAWAGANDLPVHIHVAEQPAEIGACVDEHGRGPAQLLATEGLLNERLTAVHAIHVNRREIEAFATHGATVCVCPTTERNLGDGIAPVDKYFAAGTRIALGTDSHAQIDLLEDARELEYHIRLQNYERAVLAPPEGKGLAARLFACATLGGAHSLNFDGGALEAGRPADFLTVDLQDPSIAGATPETLLDNIVFALNRAAVRDVVVGGQTVVREGRHTQQNAVVEGFGKLQKRLWG